MFIKQVTICGFKAFARTSKFGEFSPKKNCIYGLNGTGKSSFFSAIEFVFLDEYSHLRPSDRQSLLYSGQSMITSPTAFVEIVFDNSNQRIPIKDSEVSIRRSIGINKDEYFIQRKHSTRQDVINLFNSANYSITSGFFIVRQGRVKTIAEMSDSARLDLIYELSGIRSYDEQRKESVTYLEQANQRRQQISKAIQDIDKKLEEIHQEKLELEEYERINRVKRAIEYIIYETEREAIQYELNQNEKEIDDESSVVQNLQKELEPIENEISSLEASLRVTVDKIRQNEIIMKSLENKRASLIKKKANSECIQKANLQNAEDIKNILDNLINKKERMEEKLEILKSQKEEIQIECDQLKNQKIELESIIFPDTNMTDKINEDIKLVNQEIEKLEKNLEEYQQRNFDHLEQLHENCEKIDQSIEENENEKSNLEEKINFCFAETRTDLNKKKELDKMQSELEIQQREAERSYKEAVFRYDTMMGESSDAIEFIKQHFNESDGFYGQVIDLIQFDANLDSAIDASSRNRLFNLVVDNEQIAINILDFLKENNIDGRIEFLLLNQIHNSKRQIPTTEFSEPLINKIEYSANVKKAIKFVFGQIVLCSTIEKAVEISNNENFNCVTLSGDTALASGVKIGGYNSYKRSIVKTKRFIESKKENLNLVTQRLNDINNQIKKLVSELEQYEQEMKQTQKELTKITSQVEHLKQDKINANNTIEQIEKEHSLLASKLADFNHKKEKLENELEIQMQIARSKQENDDINQEQNENLFAEVTFQLNQKMGELRQIKIKLNEESKAYKNLTKNIENKQIELEKYENDKTSLIEEIESKTKEFEDEYSNIEEAMEQLNEEKTALDEQIKSQTQNKDECKKKLSNEANTYDQLRRKQSNLEQKIQEIGNKIKNLGPRPHVEIDEWQSHSKHELLNKLNEINDEMSHFRFVNKKAIDQFQKFEKDGTELKARQEDLDRSITPITELIQQLDRNKQNAIARTCRTLADNFTKFYSKLDKNRSAKLILKKRNDLDFDFSDDSDESEQNELTHNLETTRKSQLEDLTGVSILVNGEKISGLSGGERTLVSIALLFAIQQIEASPFYLLDEIDSDLDKSARESLASLVDEMTEDTDMSKQVQFIYTTHRAELMEHADQFFEMKHVNGDASVTQTDYEEARTFINDVPDNEEV